MTAKEAREFVLSKWKDAELVGYPDGDYAIFSREAGHASGTGYIGWGQTKYNVRVADEAWIDAASNLPTPVEPKAQVESASVGAISDHEKGQKEEFYKFQQHLEKTQEEISKWPSWMREAGRASMGLDQREPKEVASGGLMDLNDYESMYANAVGELKAEQEAHQASLLHEKAVVELLREAGSYIAGVGRETYGDILLERIKAEVKGE